MVLSRNNGTPAQAAPLPWGTNNGFLKIVPHIARHLVRPDIKLFGFEEQDRALVWLETGQ
jgi:hypothetical protein